MTERIKFSILLPTRNRLELLIQAIETVRRQDYQNWEIVVSDNASDSDVGKNIGLLCDRRIRCSRTDTLVPVTDNWNLTLAGSTGEYIIMLGDDDGLMKGCLRELAAVIEASNRPDLLFLEALEFAYPGVMPNHPGGYVSLNRSPFASNELDAVPIDTQTARRFVRDSLRFTHPFPFNMQHFVFSRSLVEQLISRGPFFQSPYPDYYAANAVMLSAHRIAAVQLPVVAIGISPKSFGAYYFNGRERQGVTFLNNVKDASLATELRDVIVRGSDMNTSWLFALETLSRRFPELSAKPDYSAYRRIQVRDAIIASTVPKQNRATLHDLLGTLRAVGPIESLRYAPGYLARNLPRRWIPASFKPALRFLRGRRYREFEWSERSRYQDMLDLFTRVDIRKAAISVRANRG